MESLEYLTEESKKGNRAVDVTVAYLPHSPKPSFLLFLWYGNFPAKGPKFEIKKNSCKKCCVAYYYFDYHLGWENPLVAKTKCLKGNIQFAYKDIKGIWKSLFYIRSANPFHNVGKYFDCDHDENEAEAVDSGLEKIVTLWSAKNLHGEPDSDSVSPPVNTITIKVK